jgi:mannose-6-phosphate isomerase-like protein (cupin superfamily)
MKQHLPAIVTLSREASGQEKYSNHAVAQVNDHVVRISTMTEPYHWHSHPNSDETFLVVEGGLVIEFEQGEIQLAPGQMATVCRGMRHRTRPVGRRSVNLTFEAAATKTEPSKVSA